MRRFTNHLQALNQFHPGKELAEYKLSTKCHSVSNAIQGIQHDQHNKNWKKYLKHYKHERLYNYAFALFEQVIPRMPASRHIDQPIPDQEAIEEKFIAALDLTVTEEEEHARTGNQTELSSEGNNTDTSGSTSEEEEAVFLSMMEENDDVEEKTSDTVLQEQLKMKRNLRKMAAENQQENVESAVKNVICYLCECFHIFTEIFFIFLDDNFFPVKSI